MGVKVSKNEFAEVLCRWLSKFLTKQAIKKTGKEFGFRIRNNKDFSRVFKELFVLNMWLTVYTCKRVFWGRRKRNKCLSIFHGLVYKRHTGGTEEDFGKWMKSLDTKYVEYDRAMKTRHPSTPLWVVANLINRNLFGEIREDWLLQMHIITHIEMFVKHLGKAIKQYDIE